MAKWTMKMTLTMKMKAGEGGVDDEDEGEGDDGDALRRVASRCEEGKDKPKQNNEKRGTLAEHTHASMHTHRTA